MDESSPASAGETRSMPDQGGFHMPRATMPCVTISEASFGAHRPQLLTPSAATTKACAPRVHALQQEKSP